MTLECVGDLPCQQTRLVLQKADGGLIILKKPSGLNDHIAARSLDCRKARNGQSYFEVEYDPVDGYDGMCLWRHIYTDQGNLLTRTYPPLSELYYDYGIGSQECKGNYKNITNLYKKLDISIKKYLFHELYYMFGGE